jgi:hypothetical protein
MQYGALDHNIQFCFHFVICKVKTDPVPVPIPDVFEHPKENAPAVNFIFYAFDLYVTIIMDFVMTKQSEVIANKNVVLTM